MSSAGVGARVRSTGIDQLHKASISGCSATNLRTAIQLLGIFVGCWSKGSGGSSMAVFWRGASLAIYGGKLVQVTSDNIKKY